MKNARWGIMIGVAVAGLIAIILIIKMLTGGSGAPEFQKGMHYVTWSGDGYDSERSDESLKKVASIGCDWVAILTTWYQDTCFSTDITPGKQTPSDASIIRAIKAAHENGLKVMLKPHLDLKDTSFGGWRGEIACVREPDWVEWFRKYTIFMIHYAKIAEKHNVEMFCVGTELTESTLTKPDEWRKVIRDVRKVFKGKITYAANWNNEYLSIAFWDELDYAGIDAYFPLSDKEKPTYEELKEAWKKWLKEIEAWQARIAKPVIFPEVGYHSSECAAKEPWIHASGNKVDLMLQEDCYRAMMETFWDKEWFYGIYWWDWGTSVKMGGPRNRGFTPQNKPAEELIKKWYAKHR